MPYTEQDLIDEGRRERSSSNCASTGPQYYENSLYAALAKAQGKFKPIPKNREAVIRPRDASKQPYKFRYADLEAILSSVREPLSSEGLCLIQLVNGTKLITILGHTSGGEVRSEIDLAPWLVMGDPKNYGITQAYFRRYQVNAILSLAADDDLDENGDEPGDVGDRPKHEPVKQPDRANKASGATLSEGQLKVIRAKIKGAEITEEAIAEKFGVESIDLIPAAQCNDVLAMLKGDS